MTAAASLKLMTTYILNPRIPGASWLAGVLAVVGLGLTAVSFGLVPSTALRAVGLVLLVIGLAVLLLSIIGRRRARVWVTFDDEGYTVEGPRGEFSGSWLDVTDVKYSAKTARIALYHGPNRRTLIAHPAGVQDDTFMQIRDGIRKHIEESLPDGG